MDGSSSPLFTAPGRFLTIYEMQRWQRVLKNPIQWLVIGALAAVYAAFSLQGILLAATRDVRLLLWVLPLIASCTWLVLFFLFRVRRDRRVQTEAFLMDIWQDSKAVRAGTMISFYRDHATYTTMRGSCQVRYADVTICTETADGFAIGNERFCLFVRGADLTPSGVLQIRGWLTQVIPPAIYRQKAAAFGWLSEPLPTVRFANFDRIQTRAVATRQNNREYYNFLGLVLPQLAVYGLAPAPLIPLTGWALIDIVLWSVSFCVVGFVLAQWFWRLTQSKQQATVPVVFTEEGLACQRDGVFFFLVNTRYVIRTAVQGITVRFSSGEEWEIPWSTIENVDALNLPQKGEQTNG